MDANECFQALVRCHEYHACRNAAIQSAGDFEALPMDDMFGPQIASLFAQEATRNLSQDETGPVTLVFLGPRKPAEVTPENS